MSLFRQQPPPLHPLTHPVLLEHRQWVLENGLEVFYLQDPDQEVLKIDIVLPIGAYDQPRRVMANTLVNMLNEGTSRHTSAEIAEFFDFHGSYIDFSCGLHHAEINLIALKKYAGETLRMLAEMISDSIFPEKELKTYLRNKKQQMLVNLEKTSFLARSEFLRVLYGDDHPYANQFKLSDYDRITAGEVARFHRERYTARNMCIFLSGAVDDTLLQDISDSFSAIPGKTLAETKRIPFSPAAPGLYRVTKPDAVQSSIRIGKTGIRITQEEYTRFQLLNTVLGGYFGSRLMSNIREEKGYTYGIYSFNVNMLHAAYWNIITDVNAAQTEATLEEIHKEIRRIRETPISEAELSLVKSYYYGELLRELDGPFAQADALKQKFNYGLDNHFYLRMLEDIRRCTPEDLFELAVKHLNPDKMYWIVAGPR